MNFTDGKGKKDSPKHITLHKQAERKGVKIKGVNSKPKNVNIIFPGRRVGGLRGAFTRPITKIFA